MPTRELRESHEQLMRELTRYEAVSDEGHVQATLQRLSPDQLQALAGRILEICDQLKDELRY